MFIREHEKFRYRNPIELGSASRFDIMTTVQNPSHQLRESVYAQYIGKRYSEQITWLLDNCDHRWRIETLHRFENFDEISFYLMFSEVRDAVHYKLRWVG